MINQKHEYQLVIDPIASGRVITNETFCVLLYHPLSLPFLRRAVVTRHDEWSIARTLGLDLRRTHHVEIHESTVTTFPSCNLFKIDFKGETIIRFETETDLYKWRPAIVNAFARFLRKNRRLIHSSANIKKEG